MISPWICARRWWNSLGCSPRCSGPRRYTEQTQCRLISTRAALDRRFPSEIEIGAYRLIQEALTNVARHADVREVAVGLVASEEALRLCGR